MPGRQGLTAEAPRTNRDAPLRPVVESGPAVPDCPPLCLICVVHFPLKRMICYLYMNSPCAVIVSLDSSFVAPVFRLWRCKAPCMVPHTFSLPPALGFVCLSIRTPQTSVFHNPYLCILIASCCVPMWLYLGLSVDQRRRSPQWPRPNSA